VRTNWPAISAAPASLFIDGCYDSLRDSGVAIEPRLSAEAFYAAASQSPTFDAHFFQLLFHRFLFRALVDLTRESKSPLARSLIPYFKGERDPTADVFCVVLGDKVICGPARSPARITEFSNLVSILAGMIRTGRIDLRNIRKALSPLRPTIITEQVPIAIVRVLRQRLCDAELFCVASALFTDLFIWGSFADSDVRSDVMRREDLALVFPFVVIRCYVVKALSCS
jgi:hypothetical protein